MTFEKRIAKIGRGIYTNLYANNNNKISIFLNNNSVVEKVLNIDKENYTLSTNNLVYGGAEIIKLDDDLIVVRSQNNIFLERV